MTLKIDLQPDEERALREQARSHGRDPAQFAREIIRDRVTAPDDLIDREFMAYCEREGDEAVSLDDVVAATSKIADSMTRVVIEEERAERL